MTFEGNTIISTEKLNSMLRLTPGDILNKTTLEQDYAKVTDLYYNDGYIYNSITRQEIRNEAEKSVSYKVVIVEKGRAHIENIILKGNTKTKDYVILRELPIQEGDVFSKDKVMEGIQNLYNTQFFTNVIPETPYGSAEGLMDLVINVEEGRTTEINFGVTFSGGLGDVPISGFVKWVDKNFLGRGQEFSIGAELAPSAQSLDVGFTENWLAGKRWSAGLIFRSAITRIPVSTRIFFHPAMWGCLIPLTATMYMQAQESRQTPRYYASEHRRWNDRH
jgi:outer membrane protein insertion porin family